MDFVDVVKKRRMVRNFTDVNEGLSGGFAGVTTTENYGHLRKLLNIPEEITPVGVIPFGHSVWSFRLVIPFGHPAPDVRSGSLKRGRKASVEFVHREKW